MSVFPGVGFASFPQLSHLIFSLLSVLESGCLPSLQLLPSMGLFLGPTDIHRPLCKVRLPFHPFLSLRFPLSSCAICNCQKPFKAFFLLFWRAYIILVFSCISSFVFPFPSLSLSLTVFLLLCCQGWSCTPGLKRYSFPA
jgi:hypothetical protein